MMIRHFCIAVLGLASVVSSTAAVQADFWDFPHSVARDFGRRVCWPKPFVYADQEAVYAPFDVMVSNGWHRQNTLADNHFDQNGQLTEAGRLKVQWIVLEAPEQHRAIFVHRSLVAEETAARINVVVQFASGLIRPNMMVPPVLETGVPAPSTPAERIDAIDREFVKTMIEPRLPSQSQSTGSSSSSSSQSK
jgi:hypothetical protein